MKLKCSNGDSGNNLEMKHLKMLENYDAMKRMNENIQGLRVE
jgi:hypothetical protein